MINKTKFITQDQLRRVFNKFESIEMINIQDLYASYEEELKDFSVEQMSSEDREKIEIEKLRNQIRRAKDRQADNYRGYSDNEKEFDHLCNEVKDA